jgi:PAS domain S-box-containing protein
VERRQFDQAVREQQEWFRVALSSIGDGLIATDTQGRVTFLNPVAQALTGWTQSEAQGQPLQDVFNIIHEQTRKPVENPVAQVIREGVIVGLGNHAVLIARDGTERPIDDSAAPIRDEQGTMKGVVLVFRDISERRRAERLRNVRLSTTQILVQSSSLQEAAPGLLRSIGEGLGWEVGTLWRVDQDAEVLRCEQVWHTPSVQVPEFEALTREQLFAPGIGLPGRVWADRKPAWIADVIVDPNFPRAPVADREGLHGAFAFPVLLGGEVLGVVEFFSHGIREPDDDVLEMAATIGGQIGLLLERQRAEAQLRSSERVARFLAEASAALAVLTDYESTLRQVAQLAVPFFADWCAVDMAEPDGSLRRLAVAHVDPEKLRCANELYQRYPPRPDDPRGAYHVLHTGQSEMGADISDALLVAAAQDEEHLRILREAGLRSYICVPLRVRGQTLGVITFITAESGRHYTAQDLQLAEDLAHRAAVAIDNAQLLQELRMADRKKDEFLATLAHELRNPLAPIRNTLALLKMAGTDRAVIGQAQDMMERQVAHLVRLVDDLMDVSRIMRGKIDLKKAPVDLTTVVSRAAEIAGPMIDAQGHHLTISLPPEPLLIEGDEIRLAQVVANLLNNASKYADRPGRIWLTGRREGREVVLRVKDQGIGLAPEMLHQVFDLFVQVSRLGERAQGGLGIGLSLCKRLVELHGGTITAHSEGPGKGSEFVVRLPALLNAGTGDNGESSPHHVQPRRDLPRRRVLCVDDNLDACMSLALMLRLHDQEVEMAHDGLAALDKARSYRPDIILLGISLPGLDGYEVCKRLREEPGLANVRIVALTGWGQEEDRRRSQEAGFDLHVTKPIDLQLLEDILRQPLKAGG